MNLDQTGSGLVEVSIALVLVSIAALGISHVLSTGQKGRVNLDRTLARTETNSLLRLMLNNPKSCAQLMGVDSSAPVKSWPLYAPGAEVKLYLNGPGNPPVEAGYVLDRTRFTSVRMFEVARFSETGTLVRFEIKSVAIQDKASTVADQSAEKTAQLYGGLLIVQDPDNQQRVQGCVDPAGGDGDIDLIQKQMDAKASPTIFAQHSFLNDTGTSSDLSLAPGCPVGSNLLWNGYSRMGRGGQPIALSDAKSCAPSFGDSSTVTCTESGCTVEPATQTSVWIGNGNTDPTAAPAARSARCSVCSASKMSFPMHAYSTELKDVVCPKGTSLKYLGYSLASLEGSGVKLQDTNAVTSCSRDISAKLTYLTCNAGSTKSVTCKTGDLKSTWLVAGGSPVTPDTLKDQAFRCGVCAEDEGKTQ